MGSVLVEYKKISENDFSRPSKPTKKIVLDYTKGVPERIF